MSTPPNPPRSEEAEAGGFIAHLNQSFSSIAEFCFDQRWWVIAGCLLLTAGAYSLAVQVEQDASYEAYFYEGDTTYQSYENYREDFGSDEVLYPSSTSSRT